MSDRGSWEEPTTPDGAEAPAADADRAGGQDAARSGGKATARQIRGSSLLLAGRFIALGLDFVAQVLIVRYLSKEAFGSFAFALSLVSLGASAALLGLDKTMPRFVTLYDEAGDRGRVVGSIVMGFAAVAVVGGIVVVVVGILAGRGGLAQDDVTRDLVLITILLAPVTAADALLISLFASFAGPRGIFLRRYVVGPGLQLLVVLLLIASDQDVLFLAAGWAIAGAVAVVAYGLIFVRMLDRRGRLAGLHRRDLRFPAREVFGFSLPLLSTDVVMVLRTSAVVILLQYLASTVEVADYRAAVPLARQNLIVLQSFSILFLPIASALFARRDDPSIADLYSRTTSWVAVMTFPVFVATFVLAEPVTVLLYGPEYASSAPILALLALGSFVSAALGFNALTLRVYAKVRSTVMVDGATLALGLVAMIVLIPAAGALGAAVATAGALIVQNLLYQVVMATGTPVPAIDRARARVYSSIVVATALVGAVQMVVAPPLLVGIGLVVVAWLAVAAVNRREMAVGAVFPELRRVPIVRWLA